MFDAHTLILFAGAVLVLAAIPGPDNLFVTAQALAHGRGAGLAAATGIVLGGLLWTLAASAGLTALMKAVPGLFVLIQLGGAVYLLALAAQLWRAHGAAKAPPPVAHAFGRGLGTNLLNPKVGLYYLAFLPQFVDASRAPVWAQMLVLGLIFNLAGALVMSAAALLAGTGQRAFAARGAGRILARLAALILVLIAAKLLFALAHGLAH